VRTRWKIVAGAAAVLVAYLVAWPVPVAPVAWEAPPHPGLTGPFAPNERLSKLERISIGAHEGPEDVAADATGRIYLATHDGTIVRLAADGSSPEDFARTGGRPLGIDFDAGGRLIVADAYRGLLAVAPDGAVTTLADAVDGQPIRYADDVDVAADGTIWFSDASTKFGAEANGGTFPASRLDILEHGGHGRLLAHDPATGETRVVTAGLEFANGVAVDPQQRFVAIAETGRYRVMRWWLTGDKAGTLDVLIDALPGFPDNVSIGRDGRIWIALVGPRSGVVDALAPLPFLRKVAYRLPTAMQPQAQRFGHVIAVDDQGKVVVDLQDPSGGYALTTGVLETESHLWIGSLTEPVVARLARADAGLP
jgi:sugar lactone lactonase YvrE